MAASTSNRFIVGVLLAFAAAPVFAADPPANAPVTAAPPPVEPLALALPGDGDEFSTLVARAAAEDAALDFKAMRVAYLDSAARKREKAIAGLRKEMYAAMNASDTMAVREKAAAIVSINYADFDAQTRLGAACKLAGDAACQKRAEFAANGLLNSILKSGDGKSCNTGWVVINVDEEYQMLRLVGRRMKSQALVQEPATGRSCDALVTVNAANEERSYWFALDIVMQDYRKMFGTPPQKPAAP